MIFTAKISYDEIYGVGGMGGDVLAACLLGLVVCVLLDVVDHVIQVSQFTVCRNRAARLLKCKLITNSSEVKLTKGLKERLHKAGAVGVDCCVHVDEVSAWN